MSGQYFVGLFCLALPVAAFAQDTTQLDPSTFYVAYNRYSCSDREPGSGLTSLEIQYDDERKHIAVIKYKDSGSIVYLDSDVSGELTKVESSTDNGQSTWILDFSSAQVDQVYDLTLTISRSSSGVLSGVIDLNSPVGSLNERCSQAPLPPTARTSQ